MTFLSQSSPKVFPLKSPTNFAWILGIPISDLERIAKTADHSYNPFINTKGRVIDNPSGELKAVQSKINKRILSCL